MIVGWKSPGPHEAPSVGGKAASLYRLLELGFNVPPFLVVSAEAYRNSCDGHLDSTTQARLAEFLEALGGESQAYAVRSSGLIEDSADFSYAGVFETFLDVRGLANVVEAIERCWASHGAGNAAAYRAERGITDDTAMAVVVQRMVKAEWAGVSFSADPVTQKLSVVVIDVIRGEGDALVSGGVNPEEIRLDCATGEVVAARLSSGAVAAPDWLREKVLKVTRLAADAFGFPQDLEWATEGGELFLLQSRPITTISGVFHNRSLEPWAGRGTPDAADRVWTRAYADEIWTPPVSPLFYDVQNLSFVTGEQLRNKGDRAPLPPDIFKYFRAAPYMDVAVLERLYACQPLIARRPSLLAQLPVDRHASLMRAPRYLSMMLRKLWRFEVVKGRTWGITRNHRFLERSWPAFVESARPLRDLELSRLTDAEVEAFIADVWKLAASIGTECEIAVLYYALDIKLLLCGLLERWCGAGEERYGEVSAGLENSETVREADAIWTMVTLLRAAGPDAIARAKASSWRECRQAAKHIGIQAAVAEFESFLRDHRHRGANYKDLIYPRWGDDPELLWAHVQGLLASETPRPAESNAASAARRRQAQSLSLRSVRGPLAPIKRTILRACLRWNEIYAGLRDNHRFYYDYVWWLLRRAYAEIGRRMHARGLLSQPDDIFFLVRSEIDELRQGKLQTTIAAARILVRRREWEQTRTTLPPKFLRNGYVPDEVGAGDGAAEKFSGVAASPGHAVGRARVIFDISGLSRVNKGEIIVTRQTDPGWTPAFARLGGLVLETGGVLAHGASLCREYGLPCVTAVDAATSLIHEGDLVAVSGGEGAVRILERAAVTDMPGNRLCSPEVEDRPRASGW